MKNEVDEIIQQLIVDITSVEIEICLSTMSHLQLFDAVLDMIDRSKKRLTELKKLLQEETS